MATLGKYTKHISEANRLTSTYVPEANEPVAVVDATGNRIGVCYGDGVNRLKFLPVIKDVTEELGGKVGTNDSRLSDARTPTAHSHTRSEISDFAHTHDGADITTGTVADARLSGNVAKKDVANTFTAPQIHQATTATGVPATSQNTTSNATANLHEFVKGATLMAAVDANGNLIEGGSTKTLKERFVGYADAIMEANSFGGKRLFLNNLNNAIFNARQRWTVTGNIYNADGTLYQALATSSIDKIFNGNYEDGITIPAGKYMVVNLNFGASYFPGYAYGNLYLSHYYNLHSASAKLRVYSNYAPHTIGWHEYGFSDYHRDPYALIQKAYHQKHQISEMEFVIHAPATTDARVTQVDYQLDRPTTGNEMPFVDKYAANKLYNNLTFSDGEVEVVNSAKGIVLRSPNGSRYRITVSDTGALTSTAI